MSSASVLKECLFSALIHWFWSIIGFDFGALVYWFWSIGFGAYAVTRTKKNSVLKECLCCGEVKLPGEYKARPFLQASEMKLLELIGQNSVFDIEKPFVFPEVIIRAGDQEQNGFEAEYRVYEELKKSNLHMYVFYSLKTKKNEELVDFLLVSKSSVIILEVKSFKLVDNPTVKDYETLRKKLSDNKKRQEERVKRNIKEFMSNHGCENNVDLFLYFNLFQNTKRSQLPKDTDWLPKNVLFKDDYLKVIEDIINSPKKVDENGEYTMRIFLSWLYGLHISYLKTKYQWDIMKPGQIVKKQIDEEYRKKKKKDERMNKGVADVFLTPAQKVIVECDHPVLRIIGLPGTGKTYCLILKMVNMFFELWQLHMNEPHRTNELIIVFHRNEKTLHWIRGMFWQTLEKQIERQNNNKKEITCLEEIPKLIKFISGSNVIDIETRQMFHTGECGFGTNFKVFCDDLNWDFATVDTKSRNFDVIQDVIARSNFWWLTSYSEIPALYVNSRTTNKTFDSYHSVYLTYSLRYTGSIFSLLKQLCGTDPMRHGWISGMDFNPGTRVIGEKPQFICVKDCNTMKDKVRMLLQKMEEEGIRRDEIAVIKTGVSKDIIKDILQEECITKHLAASKTKSSSSSSSGSGFVTIDTFVLNKKLRTKKFRQLKTRTYEEFLRKIGLDAEKKPKDKDDKKKRGRSSSVSSSSSHSSRSSRSSSASSRSSRSSSSSSTTSRSSSVSSTTSSSSASSAEGVSVKKDRRAGEVDFQSETSNLMSALGIGDDNLDIKDAHSVCFLHESDSQMNFSLRGMEFYHVIVCVTQMPNSFSDKKRLAAIKEGLRNKEFSRTLNCIQQIQDKSKKGWETFIAHDLVEAISRAVVGATIVYMEGDSFLSKIAEEFKSVSPEISQNNTCNKEYKVEQFIREYDSLSCSKSAPLVLSYQQKMRSGNYVLEVGGKTIEFAKAFEVDKIIEKKRKKRRN